MWMSRNAFDLMGTPDSIYNWIPGEIVVIVRLPKRPDDNDLDMLVEQVQSQLNIMVSSQYFGVAWAESVGQ